MMDALTFTFDGSESGLQVWILRGPAGAVVFQIADSIVGSQASAFLHVVNPPADYEVEDCELCGKCYHDALSNTYARNLRSSWENAGCDDKVIRSALQFWYDNALCSPVPVSEGSQVSGEAGLTSGGLESGLEEAATGADDIAMPSAPVAAPDPAAGAVGGSALSLIVCGATAADCRCVRPTGHDGAHECDPGVCGGAWTGVFNGGDFNPVRWPTVGGIAIPETAPAGQGPVFADRPNEATGAGAGDPQVPAPVAAQPLEPDDAEVGHLAGVITDAWAKGIYAGHYSLARWILDAGYRRETRPSYVLDRDAVLELAGRYAAACVEEATSGSPKGREAARDEIRDLWDAIRAALIPVPDVEPSPAWGSGPLVDHNPEAPAVSRSREAAGPTAAGNGGADPVPETPGAGSADLGYGRP